MTTEDRTAPAPVAVPEGGWRDRDQVVIRCRNDSLEIFERGVGPWGEAQDPLVDAWFRDGVVLAVHAPRPDPVVAPLPSEAVLDAVAAAIYDGGDEAEWLTTADGSPNAASYEYARRAMRRLVPEDDEDTVRVPKETAKYAAAVLADEDYVPCQEAASVIQAALDGTR